MLTALDAPFDLLDPHEQKFVTNIREHGWAETSVFAEPGHLGFSYTTGLWQGIQHPEMVLFSLPNTAHAILWEIYRDISGGTPLPVGKRISDRFGNSLPAYAFNVEKAHYPTYLGWSRWFHAGDDFPCLHIVWPDRKGRFPWETGFEAGLKGLQPDLTENGWANAVID